MHSIDICGGLASWYFVTLPISHFDPKFAQRGLTNHPCPLVCSLLVFLLMTAQCLFLFFAWNKGTWCTKVTDLIFEKSCQKWWNTPHFREEFEDFSQVSVASHWIFWIFSLELSSILSNILWKRLTRCLLVNIPCFWDLIVIFGIFYTLKLVIQHSLYYWNFEQEAPYVLIWRCRIVFKFIHEGGLMVKNPCFVDKLGE